MAKAGRPKTGRRTYECPQCNGKIGQNAYYGGKICRICYNSTYTSWNKGLTADTDSRVKRPWLGKKRTPYKMKNPRFGEKAAHWKGGITTKDKLEREKFRREMQKLIFERDDYTCQMCGIKGQKMQVDHIQSWADYVELRFSMDNCRTLCMDCHYFITFGKKKPKNIIWGHNLKRRVSP